MTRTARIHCYSIGLLTTYLLAPACVTHLFAAGWADVAGHLRGAVAELRVADPRRPGQSHLYCTAAVVGKRHLLTEEHCVDGVTGLKADQIAVKEVARDGELVLLLANGFATRWQPLQIRTDPLKVGEPVATYGYGLGGASPMFSTGVVASLSDIKIEAVFPHTMLLDLWIAPGSSGGPIVDSAGRLVSVVRGTASREDLAHHYLVRAEPHPRVVRFLKQNGL